MTYVGLGRPLSASVDLGRPLSASVDLYPLRTPLGPPLSPFFGREKELDGSPAEQAHILATQAPPPTQTYSVETTAPLDTKVC